jgi:AcrR family transcriptional regulator
MPRVSTAFKEDRRSEILEAARRCVARSGFHQTSMHDICTEAGMSPGNLYRYFPSKEAALLADFKDFLDDFVALVAARPADEHPVDSLLRTLDTIAQALPVDADAFSWIYELVEREPSLGGVQHRLLLEAQDRLTNLFAQKLGVSPRSMEPRLFASGATASYQAAVRTWVVMPPDERTMTVWTLGRAALGTFADGLRSLELPADT